MANFLTAAALVVDEEGKINDTPGDPGGLTKYGIAQNYNPDVDVKNLTLDGALAIYKAGYWRFDGVKDQRLANLLFSEAINLGLETAVKLFQESMGWTGDGIFGYVTTAGANTKRMPIPDYVAVLTKYYYTRKDAPEFFPGWMKRVAQTLIS